MKNKITLIGLLILLFLMLYYITGWSLGITTFSYLVLLGMGFGAYKYSNNV